MEIPLGDMQIPCCYQEGVVPLAEMADKGRMTVEQNVKTVLFWYHSTGIFCALGIGKGTVSILRLYSIELLDE
jgi:hypothetical protein